MGEELSFVCFVKDFTHSKNKRGDSFDVLSVEDVSGEHVFYFFQEFYFKVKDLDAVAMVVLIREMVQKQLYWLSAEFKKLRRGT